jgi:transporter family protein
MNWIFWALLSAFFAGLTAVLAKIGVTGVDSNLATALRTSVVLVFTWTIAFAATGNVTVALSRLSHRAWIFLVLSGAATGLSWLCYFRALQLGDASRVAPVDKLSVVFAVLFAAVLLHEKLSWQQWVGGSFVVVGAVILALKW